MSTHAPTFTQPLQSVVALEGSAATFEAQVSGKDHSAELTALASDLMNLLHVSEKQSLCVVVVEVVSSLSIIVRIKYHNNLQLCLRK